MAEKSVLGGMLLSKDAIGDVIERLQPDDLYRSSNRIVFEAITDLYNRDAPVDTVTVNDLLRTNGNLSTVGGALYVEDLADAVPTAANASYYAEIVSEHAMARRLLEASLRAAQLALGTGSASEKYALAMTGMETVSERRVGTGYSSAEDLLGPSMDRIEELGKLSGAVTGIPTGFADLDDLTAGFHGGQMIVVAARPGVGKALDLDTPLPTPTGWTTMGEIRPGEFLLGSGGDPVRVSAVTDVMHGRPCYEVGFSDGSSLVADADHQWALDGHGVVTTAVLLSLLAEDKTLLLPDSLRTDRTGPPRTVVSVSPVPSVPVRCVEVDSEDHLYLAGETLVPTHNSTLGMDFIRSCSIHHNLPSVLFSLEMNGFEIMQRLLSAECRVPLQNLRTGDLSDEDWDRLANRMGAVSEAPMFFDDNPSVTMLEIRAKCRQIKQKYGLSLVVIDYLQLMSGDGRAESRQQEVSMMSRSVKLLAKELDVPVVIMSQLNRGSEQRADKKPQVSDLRESGAIEQDADMVILLYREDAFDKESVRAGEADLIVAKHRNGPTRTITVTSQLHYSRFYDMARDH